MIIRAARVADAEDIATIWNAEIRTGISTFNSVEKSVSEIQAMIRDHAGVFQVAAHDGAVVGFATYFPFRGGVGYRFSKEHTIYLAPEARGLGIGRAMMQTLCEIAQLNGVHSLMAGLSDENEASIRFHAALGFQEVARIPEVGHKFDRWMGLILMQKIL